MLSSSAPYWVSGTGIFATRLVASLGAPVSRRSGRAIFPALLLHSALAIATVETSRMKAHSRARAHACERARRPPLFFAATPGDRRSDDRSFRSRSTSDSREFSAYRVRHYPHASANARRAIINSSSKIRRALGPTKCRSSLGCVFFFFSLFFFLFGTLTHAGIRRCCISARSRRRVDGDKFHVSGRLRVENLRNSNRLSFAYSSYEQC